MDSQIYYVNGQISVDGGRVTIQLNHGDLDGTSARTEKVKGTILVDGTGLWKINLASGLGMPSPAIQAGLNSLETLEGRIRRSEGRGSEIMVNARGASAASDGTPPPRQNKRKRTELRL